MAADPYTTLGFVAIQVGNADLIVSKVIMFYLEVNRKGAEHSFARTVEKDHGRSAT